MDRDILSLDTNLEDVLLEGFSLGRSGSRSENKTVQEELEASGRSLKTKVVLQESSLSSKLADITAEVNTAPVEPHCEYNPDTPSSPFTYLEGSDGYSVDSDALAALVEEAVSGGSYTATLEIPVVTTPPTASLEDLKANTSLISSFSTKFNTDSKNRSYNLALGCEKLNGTVVQPGETFSFNKTVGPRTEAEGWKSAKVIVNGSSYEDDYGGGICQVSTTLFNAVLMADIDFSSMSRVHHSIPSDYVDKGLDATVVYDSKDYTFVNSKDYPIYIIASIDQEAGVLTFSIYGSPLEEGLSIRVYSTVDEELAPPEALLIEDPTEPTSYKKELTKARKGYRTTAYREYSKNGEVIKTEKLYSDTYKPVQGVYNVGAASSEPAPDPAVDIPEE